MREGPILMSGAMVRAILEGRKTQTRRVVKRNASGRVQFGKRQWHVEDPDAVLGCKYGNKGDLLWVRETFAAPWGKDYKFPNGRSGIFYRADDKTQRPDDGAWKPSIHMPRWASRITLEITGVKVERLHDISAKDIIAEGAVERPHHVEFLGKCPVSAFDGVCYPDLKSLWAHGWESVYGKGSWAKNLFVWVIEFKKL